MHGETVKSKLIQFIFVVVKRLLKSHIIFQYKIKNFSLLHLTFPYSTELYIQCFHFFFYFMEDVFLFLFFRKELRPPLWIPLLFNIVISDLCYKRVFRIFCNL